ncbi:hypothetical protein E4U55_004019 [Claviceps digitariae]|nr:hypothetical protein E4U55_004019 [Claviceps digitariae]
MPMDGNVNIMTNSDNDAELVNGAFPIQHLYINVNIMTNSDNDAELGNGAFPIQHFLVATPAQARIAKHPAMALPADMGSPSLFIQAHDAKQLLIKHANTHSLTLYVRSPREQPGHDTIHSILKGSETARKTRWLFGHERPILNHLASAKSQVRLPGPNASLAKLLGDQTSSGRDVVHGNLCKNDKDESPLHRYLLRKPICFAGQNPVLPRTVTRGQGFRASEACRPVTQNEQRWTNKS